MGRLPAHSRGRLHLIVSLLAGARVARAALLSRAAKAKKALEEAEAVLSALKK